MALNIEWRFAGVYFALICSTKLPYYSRRLFVRFSSCIFMSFSSNIIVCSSPNCVPSYKNMMPLVSYRKSFGSYAVLRPRSFRMPHVL